MKSRHPHLAVWDRLTDEHMAQIVRSYQRTIDIRFDAIGSLERAEIMGCIIAGTFEGREWNLTALAVRLRMPRATLTRAVHRLEREGFLTITQEDGSNRRLHATAQAKALGREVFFKLAVVMTEAVVELPLILSAKNLPKHSADL